MRASTKRQQRTITVPTCGQAQAARPFRVVPTDVAGVTATEMLDEHVLDVLRADGRLGPAEIGTARYDAGTALRALYAATGLEPHVVAAGIAGRGGLSEESDQQAEAMASYTRQMRRLRVHAAVLRRTCIEGLVPDRLDRLVMALDALARDQDRSKAQREAIDEIERKRRIER